MKEEKKETPVTKTATDDVNGETKSGKASSVKSGDLSGERRRSKSSKTKDEQRTSSKERGKPRTSVLTFAQIKVGRSLIHAKCAKLFSFGYSFWFCLSGGT